MEKQYERSEDNIKALQSVGQIIGEVLKQLDDDRCKATTSLFRPSSHVYILD
jgi:26S proteasome regulatory subunit T4